MASYQERGLYEGLKIYLKQRLARFQLSVLLNYFLKLFENFSTKTSLRSCSKTY